MSLPRQLFLLGLMLLALPAAGWQVAVQVETFLREAREEALLATVGALARNWALDDTDELATAGEGLYLHRVTRPIITDGYADDWAAWQPWAASFSSADDRLQVALNLCRDERWLYALVRVRDDTPQRGRFSPAGLEEGDHLVLALEDRRGIRQLRLMPSVPGNLDVVPVGQSAGLRDLPLNGAWREQPDGGGYVVEFSLPLALAEQRLGLAAVDSDRPYVGADPAIAGTLDGSDASGPGLRSLTEANPSWSRRLKELGPGQGRLWLVDSAGRVMAQAGHIDVTGSAQRRWWRSLVYRLLAHQVLSAPEDRDPAANLRLEGVEVSTALAGTPRVRWEPASAAYTVVASVAAPVRRDGRVVGAVIMEQVSDGLLLAANHTVTRTVSLSLAVVVLIIALLLTFASIHSWRIRRLRDAVDSALDGQGQTFERLPASGAGDEIGDLSRSFSALLDELGQYNAYLRSLAGKLSHELNTPLAVVRSSLDNLAHEPLPEGAETYLERARDGGERLRAILRAMSEAHRLEESLSAHDAEDFDLTAVVQGCFDAYRSLAPDFDWQLQLPEQPCHMHGSPELLAQLLDKLVDNARSFAPDGGQIRISLQRGRTSVMLRVANEGPPLPEKLQGNLFQSLVSVRDRQDEALHLGLGLHMVRLIARAHDGAVAARNIDEPGGVEFSVRLRGMPKHD